MSYKFALYDVIQHHVPSDEKTVMVWAFMTENDISMFFCTVWWVVNGIWWRRLRPSYYKDLHFTPQSESFTSILRLKWIVVFGIRIFAWNVTECSNNRVKVHSHEYNPVINQEACKQPQTSLWLRVNKNYWEEIDSVVLFLKGLSQRYRDRKCL